MTLTAEPMPLDTALVPTDKGTPLPIFTGSEMTTALVAYRELQTALDKSMPEQIMELDGKPFRKKGYWRAIAVAFNLTVEPLTELREVHGLFEDGRDNFGYVVTYRASTQTGRAMTGDGACFAVEKARRFKCPHLEREGSTRTVHYPHDRCPEFDANFQWRALPAQATEHNIRSHAHTRAFNRAVSNLVGFGEVSAEEVDRDESPSNGHSAPSAPAPARTTNGHGPATTNIISEAQAKRFFAIAMNAGWVATPLKAWLVSKIGTEDDRQIPRNIYDRLCAEVKDEAPR